jgi:hypothetical protein
MPAKKGGGLVEALWTGTAFYAASHADSFTGFLKSFAMYALVLIVGALVLAWVLGAVGLMPRERFTIADIPCPQGSTPETRNGESVCVTPSGTVTVMPAA